MGSSVAKPAKAVAAPAAAAQPAAPPKSAKMLWKKAALVYQVGNVIVDLTKNKRDIQCDAYPDVPLDSDAVPDADTAADADTAEAVRLVRQARLTKTEEELLEDADEDYINGFTDDDEAPVLDRPPVSDGDEPEYEVAVQELHTVLTEDERHQLVWPNIKRGEEHAIAARNRERCQILAEAKRVGDNRDEKTDPRKILILYNPVSGGGKAKKIVAHLVEPVLKLARVKYTVQATQYRRHAVELVQALNLGEYQGIIVAGGDGLVHEVVTGYFLHPDQERIKEVGIAITPSGTANAMAHALHTHANKSVVSVIGRAALAAAKGTTTRAVDVIHCTSYADPAMTAVTEHVYALSVFGWGLAGAVALKADKLRWLPGQRSARYDIAGFVTMIQDWPVIDNGTLEYWDGTLDAAGGKVWQTTEVSCINLVATNLAKLGNDHPIWPTITPDDGTLAFSYIDGKNGRLDVARLAMAMKRGKYLGEQPGVISYIVKEFKLTPTIGKCKSPYLIDGDPHDFTPVHVEVLHKGLTVFVLPEAGIKAATGVAAGMAAAIAPALGMNLNVAAQKHKDAANSHGLAAGLGGMLFGGGAAAAPAAQEH